MDNEKAIERLRSRTPGVDPEDPYRDTEIDSLPEWWQRAIREFENHELRPYRPPRFEDNTLVHDAVDGLEQELEVDIRFASIDTDYRSEWSILLDGRSVGTVGRHRSSEGYTVYEIEGAEFGSLVRNACETGRSLPD